MPNHIVHERTGILTAPAVFAGTIFFIPNLTIALGATVAYIAATYFFSPDLDTESVPYFRWNFLSLIWWPYMKLIPHRSWLSHSGPISGTLRFFYFLGAVYIIQTLLRIFVNSTIDLLTFHTAYAILWVAIILADTVHCILDFMWK